MNMSKANDNSGYIGAAIVGGFVLMLCGCYGGRFVMKWKGGRNKKDRPEDVSEAGNEA